MSAPFSLGTAPYVKDGVTCVPLSLFDALLGNNPGTITMDGNKIAINTAPENNVEQPNPFTDCENLDGVQKIAGFDISVLEKPSGFDDAKYRTIKGDLIEVIYSNDEDKLRIRKGIGNEDISGDFCEYDEINTVAVGNLQITMKGSDGKVNLATWTNGGYTFAVSTGESMTAAQMTDLVKAVK